MELHKIEKPKLSEWECYLFGSKPGNRFSMRYCPEEGNVPNWFVRWMMKVCLGCTWVKKQQKQTE